MINRDIFDKEIKILSSWFGKEFIPEVLERLYDRLNSHGLTEEEFCKACLILFDTSHHFPNPQAFVDAARGDREAVAAKEWDWILKAAASSMPERYLKNVTDPGIAAIKELGGVRKLGQAEQRELPFIRKEFIERWLKLDQTFKTEQVQVNNYPQLGENNGTAIIKK